MFMFIFKVFQILRAMKHMEVDVISVLNPRISKQLAMYLHCLKAISFLQRYKSSVYGTCFMEITTCISKSKSSLCFY